MTSDAVLMSEIWDIFKERISEDDYQEVCEKLVATMDCHNMSDGFLEEDFDEHLSLAIITYFGEDVSGFSDD